MPEKQNGISLCRMSFIEIAGRITELLRERTCISYYMLKREWPYALHAAKGLLEEWKAMS